MSIDYENRKPVISMKDIKKEFSGVWALSGITFDVYAGEVHCLVGENGAGKSTLMKVLSGAYTPTAGSIEVDGTTYQKLDPTLSKQLGINIVYQENDLVPSMDVVENIYVGNEKVKGPGLVGLQGHGNRDPPPDERAWHRFEAEYEDRKPFGFRISSL